MGIFSRHSPATREPNVMPASATSPAPAGAATPAELPAGPDKDALPPLPGN